MYIPRLIAFLISVIILETPAHAEFCIPHRCTFGEKCWPDEHSWQALNATVGGRLIRSFPSAAVCHQGPSYDAQACDIAEKNWDNSFWRTNQSGAYSALVWEMGKYGQCYLDDFHQPCDQGRVPYYSVDARSVEDIQFSVNFARDKDLYLVVKNTGHDHLGRSSGKGSFSIWTHHLKGIDWHDSFIPEGAAPETSGIPAVTIQPGEQWLDVYRAAAARNVIVVGGSARTVGAAGGYVLGGGHSPFAHYYGLAADNVLEMTIVSADGTHRTVNNNTDPDYFWALRGGGGNAWGVLTSVTYKTHHVPQSFIIGWTQINTTSNETFKKVAKQCLQLIPTITEAGFTGYANIEGGFSAIFVQPNGTLENFNKTFAPLEKLSNIPGVSAQMAAYPASWDMYLDTFLKDPNIATNIQDASRLLTADVLQNKTDELIELILESGDGAGFNWNPISNEIISDKSLVGQANNDERDNTAVHEIWKQAHGVFSISTDWNDNATAEEKHRKREVMVHLSNRLTDIVGEDGGTYVNEANPYEPNWQQVFWGDKYQRLLSIKKRVDPTNLLVCNRCVGTDIILEP
ncbi:FAD binding domain protein [Talaromyces proteolyticus]|uniref:FAD binding domain protein n=1 Tax=Talaromyces proteolyticus TaxID=1131652 RepID=A0AAD4PY62_9EURO|nr:FAD binding domain protein [Talaromyces proteolyticus]KAH8697409.1 FAD binding domain protein [Talaromyces proteolyticus]